MTTGATQPVKGTLQAASPSVDPYRMGWISARARAERSPIRLTVALTLGELPEGWARPHRPRAIRIWIGVAGLLLVAPFASMLAAGALRVAGLGQPYAWIASSPAAIIAVTLSLVIGLPIAFVINVWPITRLGMRRHAGELEGLLALEFAPLHLLVVVLAMLVGGLFIAHLAADAYACVNGVHSAC